MNVQGLHVNHIKSHLQKYRLNLGPGLQMDEVESRMTGTAQTMTERNNDREKGLGEEDESGQGAMEDEDNMDDRHHSEEEKEAKYLELPVKTKPLPVFPPATLKELCVRGGGDEETQSHQMGMEYDRQGKRQLNDEDTEVHNPLDLLAALASKSEKPCNLGASPGINSVDDLRRGDSRRSPHAQQQEPLNAREDISRLRSMLPQGSREVQQLLHELDVLIHSMHEQAKIYTQALQTTQSMINHLMHIRELFIGISLYLQGEQRTGDLDLIVKSVLNRQ